MLPDFGCAYLEERSDADIEAMYYRALQIMAEAIEKVQADFKMTLPERCLWEAQFNCGAGMFELWSPRGGTVADHLPAGYRGRALANQGLYVEELRWNVLPWDVPLGVKVSISGAQYVEAKEMLDAPDGDTPENKVRFLVAEAQFAMLVRWPAFVASVSQPQRPATRTEMENALIRFVDLSLPALLKARKAVH